MRRAPARPVRACFVRSCCTDVVQEHDLRATPVQCNAKRRLSLHFTLHTSSHRKKCELFAPHLTSSYLIPSLLTCHLNKFFSTVFISSEHWSTFFISSKFFSTHLSCSARQKSLTVREKFLVQKNDWAQKPFVHISLRNRSIYTENPLQNTLNYKACTKHFPVLLMSTSDL